MSDVSRTALRPRGATVAVFALVVMIVWTIVVKYLVPLVWFYAERSAGRLPAAVPVMWDLWPLVHGALAVLLWRNHAFARAAAIAVSLAEIAVVVTKFAIYLRAPDLSFFRLLWFTNKCYVLLTFITLLAWSASAAGRRLGSSAAGSPRARTEALS